MGQQQLLLIVLSTIIVGISIVVGINMFSTSAIQANQDAVNRDVVTIAARAQEYWRKPVQLAGGGRSFQLPDGSGDVTLTALNWPATNANGSYAIVISGDEMTITGTGVEDAGGTAGPLTVAVTVDSVNVSEATIVP